MIYLLKIRKKYSLPEVDIPLWLMVSLVKLPGELHSPVLFVGSYRKPIQEEWYIHEPPMNPQ
jgi:hypothetical protein